MASPQEARVSFVIVEALPTTSFLVVSGRSTDEQNIWKKYIITKANSLSAPHTQTYFTSISLSPDVAAILSRLFAERRLPSK
jgi:hypothetical protein